MALLNSVQPGPVYMQLAKIAKELTLAAKTRILFHLRSASYSRTPAVPRSNPHERTESEAIYRDVTAPPQQASRVHRVISKLQIQLE